MTDQDFKARVLNFIEKTENFIEKTENFIEKTEEWKQEVSRELGEWKQEVSRELGWIRGKLEGKEEASSAMWGKVGAVAGCGAAIVALVALFLSLK